MPYLTSSNDIQWHYDIRGEGEGLLFLHGWGVDRTIWRQQLKYFAKQYKVLSVDLPGHGESGWQKIDLSGMADDLSELLTHLSLSQVSTVGSSLGGLFALKLYEVYPRLFKRMIFVGSMPKFAKSDDYPYGLGVPQIRKLDRQLETAYPSIVNIFFRSLFTKEERASRRFKWIQKFRQSDDVPVKPALAEYLNVLEQEDLWYVLKAVVVPMQFINGTGDTICTPEAVKLLRTLSPYARFDDFQGCGHFPFLSKPYEFNEVLEVFLRHDV